MNRPHCKTCDRCGGCFNENEIDLYDGEWLCNDCEQLDFKYSADIDKDDKEVENENN